VPRLTADGEIQQEQDLGEYHALEHERPMLIGGAKVGYSIEGERGSECLVSLCVPWSWLNTQSKLQLDIGENICTIEKLVCLGMI
jgi:hypothetical protein